MVCPSCNFENAEQNRFCGGCGAPLAKKCAACGHENEPRNRFCGQCGHKLDGAAPKSTGTKERPAQKESPVERRQITVLFCDLVGSTDLSDRMDPEDLRELVREYQLAASQVIDRYGGHIAQYLGDGILVYFGYPRAYEDSPRRALLTGLGIVEAMTELSLSIRARYGIDLAVRVGIHTGSGVVGDVGGGSKREQLLIGRAPNVAARLQGKAQPDEVVVSSVTHGLTEQFFIFESLGKHALKGLSESMEVYRVVASQRLSRVMDRPSHRVLSPFMGRRRELAALLERYRLSRDGQGQLALITSEAGLGKSRIVQSLCSQIGREEALWLSCAGSPYTRNSAFHPLVEMFRGLLQIDPDQPPEENLDTLEKGLESYGQLVAEAVPLFATLLSIDDDDRIEAPNLSPQAQRQRTLSLLVDVLLRHAATQPVLFIVEDAHWLDPSTLQFIDTLAENISRTRIFVVMTYRPSFQERWLSMPNCLRIQLQPLSPEDVTNLVKKLAQGRKLPPRLIESLVEKTDGVPLFVEELTKSLLESNFAVAEDNGDGKLLDIPATLRDTLTARLDRIDAGAKEIAQLASAIGRNFSFAVLAGVSGRSHGTLQRELDHLMDAELVYPDEAAPGEGAYLFKHALIQDTAYESMLRSRRREIHGTIARVLAEEFPAVAENQPELLAHHFERAEKLTDAVEYLERAGQRGIASSAYQEAISQLAHAIELLAKEPESAARSQREIQLRLAMGGGLIATKGYAAPEVQENYSRAQLLCSGLESSVQLIPVVYGLWVFNLARSNRTTTLGFADTLFELSDQAENKTHKLSSISAYAITNFYAGKLDSAQKNFERVQSLYRPDMHGDLGRTFGDDSGVYAGVYLAWLHLLAGRPDRALEQDRAARELAEKLSDPLAESTIAVFSMLLRHDLYDVEGTRAMADSVITLASEQGFPFWLALGRVGRGWSRIKKGEFDDGIAEIVEGLGFLRAIDQKLPATYWSSYLAEAYLDSRRIAEGLEVIGEAISLAESNMDSFYAPELYRIEGELLRLDNGREDEAMERFLKAQAVARDYGVKLLELRAAVSAGRLWRDRGQNDLAKKSVAELYEQFSEGSDTRDLRQAAALIAEVSHLPE